jgi:hypothetical protein
VLALRHRIHHDADKVSAVAAFIENRHRELLGIEPGTPETFAAEPGFKDLFAVLSTLHGAETRNQNLVKRQITTVGGKPT